MLKLCFYHLKAMLLLCNTIDIALLHHCFYVFYRAGSDEVTKDAPILLIIKGKRKQPFRGSVAEVSQRDAEVTQRVEKA